MQQNLKSVILHCFFILYKKLTPYSTQFLAFFEPLIPFFVTFYLKRKMEALIQNKTINGYYIEIVRISKFRYSVRFKFAATSNQIFSVILNGINTVLRRLQNG